MGTVGAVTGKLQLAVHNRLAGSKNSKYGGAHLTDATIYEDFNVTVTNVARETKVLWGPVHAPFLVQAKEDMSRLIQVRHRTAVFIITVGYSLDFSFSYLTYNLPNNVTD